MLSSVRSVKTKAKTAPSRRKTARSDEKAGTPGRGKEAFVSEVRASEGRGGGRRGTGPWCWESGRVLRETGPLKALAKTRSPRLVRAPGAAGPDAWRAGVGLGEPLICLALPLGGGLREDAT